MAGRPETKQYWIDQLSEYWDSGFTIQEYCELKDLSYESARRWISQLKKERAGQDQSEEALEFVEVALTQPEVPCLETGIKLYSNGVEVKIEKNFDRMTLSQVLQVLKGLPCSASADQ